MILHGFNKDFLLIGIKVRQSNRRGKSNLSLVYIPKERRNKVGQTDIPLNLSAAVCFGYDVCCFRLPGKLSGGFVGCFALMLECFELHLVGEGFFAWQ